MEGRPGEEGGVRQAPLFQRQAVANLQERPLPHPSPLQAGLSHMAGCLEVATRAPLAPPLPACGERSILRAEPWRSEANRVRGLVHKLRLAANAPLTRIPRCARNPTSPRTRGEVAQVALPRTSRYQLKCDSPALQGGGRSKPHARCFSRNAARVADSLLPQKAE